MTTSTSLLGSVERNNVVLGATRMFVAPTSTGIDESSRFNTLHPPSPFLDLGASDQSTSASFSSQYYNYMIGLPRVLKDKKVISRDLVVNISLDQFSGANLSRALYNTNYAIKIFFSTPAIVQAAAVPVGNVVQMTSSTNYVENQYIALAVSSGGLPNSLDEYRIVEISGNYLILDRDVATVFVAAPYVGMIKSWKVPYGSPKPNEIAVVLVFENTDSDGQLVISVPSAVIQGNFQFGIPATEHAKLQMEIVGQSFFDIDIVNNSLATILKFAS